MQTRTIISLFFVIALITGCALEKSHVKVENLRVEYLVNPLGISETKPRLSWILESDKRGVKQSAYRIMVASTPENLKKNNGDLWDSGKIKGQSTSQIVYEGKPLSSRDKCYWKVRIWDNKGMVSEYSIPSSWTMGLLNTDDWQAKWIMLKNTTPQDKKTQGPPSPFFRKTFSIDKMPSKAFIYASARGVFELHINGTRVGCDVFAPECTDYDKRIQFRTYEVTNLLNQGENTIGAILGEGWYSGFFGWMCDRGHYGFQNSLLVQLETEDQDGKISSIPSDDTWKCSTGPIITSDFFMGEIYDSRLEIAGWDSSGFDDSGWKNADITEKPSVILVSQPSEPVIVAEEITPISVTEPKDGVFVFNMGQNISGWIRLNNIQGSSGTEITLKFGERLNPDGTVYTTNLRAAKSTDKYIMKGGNPETWEPRFTYHGFQYVEITGFPGVPDNDTITGRVIHSNLTETGKFECSNDMLNKLWKNILWTQRDNYVSIPTDCPQRDERLGWSGDAQVFAEAGAYNMDVAAFLSKWLKDLSDGQSSEGAYPDTAPRCKIDYLSINLEAAPGWGDAGVIVPWTLYNFYNDKRVIDTQWDSMVKWMDFLYKYNPDLIRKNKLNLNYGDWLCLPPDTGQGEPSIVKTLLATAYWAYDAQLMSEMAAASGRTEDADKYNKLSEEIKSAFNKEFIEPDGHLKGGTQTCYVLALYMNLVPDDLRAKAAEFLVEDIKSKDWHLSTGFNGTRYLLPVLTDNGYEDVAYRLLISDTYPSWGYSIKQGATTIWERWDGWTEEKGFQSPGMNSFNHYSFGAVAQWIYKNIAGIQLDGNSPGFAGVKIRPLIGGGLTHAKAEYNSINGLIKTEWKLQGNSYSLDVTVPPNVEASIYVPCDEGSEVTENGKVASKSEGLSFKGHENGYNVFDAGSGSYSFKSQLTSN